MKTKNPQVEFQKELKEEARVTARISEMRIKEIYEITKKEIANGQDIYEYIPLLWGLIKDEDFEAAEGIRLALADLGLRLEIPESEDELDKMEEYIKQQKIALR